MRFLLFLSLASAAIGAMGVNVLVSPPNILANFTVPKGGQVCQKFDSTTPVTFGPSPEFTGKIENKSGFEFRDLSVWIKDTSKKPPTVVTIGGGGSNPPITSIKVKKSATSTASLSAVLTENGVPTFNLPASMDLNSGGSLDYDLEVSNFTKPASWELCMLFSTKRIPTSNRHYNVLEEVLVSGTTSSAFVDGVAPQTRASVAFKVENEDNTKVTKSMSVELISNAASLTIVDVFVTDLADAVLSSATTAVASDGKSVAIDSLTLEPGHELKLWIGLSSSYAEATTFKVTPTLE